VRIGPEAALAVLLSTLPASGCARPPAPPPLESSPSAESPSYLAALGVPTQTVSIAALGVEDRAAWLAWRPRFELIDWDDRRRAYAVVADQDDPNAVRILGRFADGDGDSLITSLHGDAPSRRFEVRWSFESEDAPAPIPSTVVTYCVELDPAHPRGARLPVTYGVGASCDLGKAPRGAMTARGVLIVVHAFRH